MNKKIISLSLMAAFVISTSCAMAETTIYTDGLGRMHFLGKDPASNKAQYNYNNSAAQDLTRKLYDGTKEVNNDTSFDQHPLKNYENTFPDFRFTNWRKKYESNIDGENPSTENRVKGSFSSQKGHSEVGAYSNTQFLEKNEESVKNTIKDESKLSKKEKKNKKNKNKNKNK